MTTTDLDFGVRSGIAGQPYDTTVTVNALREVIFGEHGELHRRVRDIMLGLADTPRPGLTFAQQAALAPALLRSAITGLGRPARDIAADTQLRGALCDWAQVAAPRLLPVLTGHFDLVIGAILALGNGSDYQEQHLADLDTGAALGVFMLTELGGTNGADQQTTATWDATTGEFLLDTPFTAAAKFMPNVAEPGVPKIVVATARLIVDNQDQGVLPFLFTLRTADGLTPGVEVVRLPEKTTAPMDHAIIRFRRVRLPREALLGGDWARMHPDGRFECALPTRTRFHRAIVGLDNGRLDLANAAVASARAALAGIVNYAIQRRPAGGTRMADRDPVQADLATGLAAVYATGVLGRHLRDLRTSNTGDPHRATLAMLAKPLLSDTAHAVLMTCSQRAGAQGALQINHIADWISVMAGTRVAEGENQIMQVTAGKSRTDLTAIRLPHTPDTLPWYIDMLADRERRIAAGIRTGDHDPAATALGPDSAAIELATATGERLAATALTIAAAAAPDPTARKLATSAAAAYALDRIHARGAWYTTHPDMPRVTPELRRHRAELIAHLPTMVAAFDLPALPGPIFRPDYLKAWEQEIGWDDTGTAVPPADPIHQQTGSGFRRALRSVFGPGRQ